MYLQKVKFVLTTFLVLLMLFSVVMLTQSIVTLYQARYVAVAAIVAAILGGYYIVYHRQTW
jgi:phosphatidylglycerophosphate synthase